MSEVQLKDIEPLPSVEGIVALNGLLQSIIDLNEHPDSVQTVQRLQAHTTVFSRLFSPHDDGPEEAGKTSELIEETPRYERREIVDGLLETRNAVVQGYAYKDKLLPVSRGIFHSIGTQIATSGAVCRDFIPLAYDVLFSSLAELDQRRKPAPEDVRIIRSALWNEYTRAYEGYTTREVEPTEVMGNITQAYRHIGFPKGFLGRLAARYVWAVNPFIRGV